MNKTLCVSRPLRNRAIQIWLISSLVLPSISQAQTTALPSSDANDAPAEPAAQPAGTGEDGDIVVLSPFEVRAEDTEGYVATTTLGGTLIRTDLSDVGSAISVYTKEFMEDIGAFDNETLLAFTVNTDVGGAQGTFVNANSQGEENENFGNGNANTRIRGLVAADNTTNFFKSDISWDGYNTDRVDVVRGANSMLFGLGSPAGIINASWIKANDRNRGQAQVRFDEFGSLRASIDYNHVVLKDQLSVRVALLDNHQKFKQKPAFNHDKRQYITAKIAPKFLQFERSTFKIDVSSEMGDIESNSRRGQPPVDQISYFFMPRSEGGLAGNVINRLDPLQVEAWLTGNPLVSNAWGNGTIVLAYNGGAQPERIFEKEINSAWGYRISGNQALINVPSASGSSNTSIGNTQLASISTIQPVFLNGYQAYAQLKGFQFADRYRDRVLTDTTYYNFFEKLIDGNSKREMRDWSQSHVELTHTFFDNKLSYNLQYFEQYMDFNRYAALGSSSTLEVDAGQLLPDGQPNPYAGRAYLRESPFTGSRAQEINRNAWRAVVLYEHDFKDTSDTGLVRWLGQHSITGTLSGTESDSERSDYMSNGVGQEWVDNRLVFANATQRDQFQTRARTLNYFYVSDSLVGKQPGDNLGVRNIGPGTPPITGDFQYRYFDADYRKFNPAVSPTALVPGLNNVRQAVNPANYAGWTTGTIKLYGAQTDRASRDYLTRTRDYILEQIDSKAISWQGRFFNRSIVGTWGMREDEFKLWNYTWDEGLTTAAGFDPDLAAYKFAPRVDKGTRSNWSVVAHLDEMFPRLPFNFSLLYGKGENSSPDPTRLDILRRPQLKATGKTTDMSVIIAPKDEKWVLRLTKYETAVKNGTSSATLQSQKFLLEQAFAQSFQGVYRTMPVEEGGQALEYYGSPSAALVAKETAGTLTPAETAQLALQRTNVAANLEAARAWLAWEEEFAARFPEAVAAWNVAGTFPGSINTPGMAWSYPENAVLVEDTISKGMEAEFTANLTRSWRMAVSASKTEAIRDNIPGPEFREILEFIYESWQGVAGRVAMNASATTNGAPSVNNTPRERFSGLWDTYQQQLQQNGSIVGELSKWRFNFVTNYGFRSGKLNGFSIGGNYRYESPKNIGYGYMLDENGRTALDLSQPYKNKAIHTVGLSLRYSRKLTDRIRWDIQANISNLFEGDKVIATSTQPDGSILRGMIREGRTWAVTNTFQF